MSEQMINIEGVGKKFCKSLKKSMWYGMSDIFKNSLGLSNESKQLRKEEFWAVDDVSFKLKQGEILGIIGPNGSGKSTILKLLNGIYMPDKGKITIKGRVGALIQVGAGFHPMLTGKENIYLNGTIMGMSKKEITNKFDSIVDFADIGDFLDSPLKYYSSGMHVRLGFAVAAHCEPDILLVDEVLAVGDERFRRKCYAKMEEILKKASIILVSHSMFQINKLCHKTIYLNKGRVQVLGSPEDAIRKYYIDSSIPQLMPQGIKKEELVRFDSLYFEDPHGEKLDTINVFDNTKLILNFRYMEPLSEPHFSVRFYQAEGIRLGEINYNPDPSEHRNDKQRLEIMINKLSLPPGKYYIEIRISEKSHVAGCWLNALYFDVTAQDYNIYGYGNTFCAIDAQCEYL